MNPYSKECRSLLAKMETADSVEHVNAYFSDLVGMLYVLRGDRVKTLTEKKVWPKLKNPPNMDVD